MAHVTTRSREGGGGSEASLSHDSLDLPRAFGPYLLLRRLAVGGMAEVYVARARGISGFEKLVAIKVIHPRYSEDEHFVTLLVEEAKISVLLTHVNVGQIFDLGVVDGTYYIALEYIEGADAYRMQRKASDAGVSLPIDVCTFIAAEVCHGLDYAHRKRDADGKPLGIVHRDISPQNVLISFAGEVKIVDFGIAKAALRTGQTEAGVIKGKYYYMSPEQAWGDPMDHRSDIFSAGIVLYELLIGEMLYREDNIPMLLDRVRKAEIPPPHTRRPDVSPELSAIIMRALAKQPEDRFQSAHEMAQALMQLLYKTWPSFTSAQVSQLMVQLFPTEIRRNEELAARAAEEHDAAEAADAARTSAPAKASGTRPVPARLPPAAAKAALRAEPVPTKAPPARAAAFELADDEEIDDQTRNDVMPFRRSLEMKYREATGQTDTEEVDPANLEREEATRALSAPSKRADATGPLSTRQAEEEPNWDDDATSVLGGGDVRLKLAQLRGAAPVAADAVVAPPRPAAVPRAVVVPSAAVAASAAVAPRAAVAPSTNTEPETEWGDEHTAIDDGVTSAGAPAMPARPVPAPAAAPAPSPPVARRPPARPRSLPPPSRRPPPPPVRSSPAMPSSSALAPPRLPRTAAAAAEASARPQPQPSRPPAQPRPHAQAPLPPPYPQAYVQPEPRVQPRAQRPPEQEPEPQPQAPPPPQPQAQAQAAWQAPPPPQPQAQAAWQAPPRIASPFDSVGFEPPPAAVATAWPPGAAGGPQWPAATGSPASLDPRVGPAFDPFAPQPAAGATTALYPTVSADEGGQRRGLLLVLIGAALVVVLIALGVSTFFATRKVAAPPRIISVPAMAHVRIDGVDLPGLTPLVLSAPLDPERPHDIDVSLDQFEPYRIVVPVGDRQPSYVAILTPK